MTFTSSTGRPISGIHGTGSNIENAWLKEIREKGSYETYVVINSETAKKKNLRDGDRVSWNPGTGRRREG